MVEKVRCRHSLPEHLLCLIQPAVFTDDVSGVHSSGELVQFHRVEFVAIEKGGEAHVEFEQSVGSERSTMVEMTLCGITIVVKRG